MSIATVKVKFEKTVVATGYQIKTTILEASFLPTQLIVINREDLSFDRMAYEYDIDTYPTSSTPGLPFYRVSTHTKIFSAEDKPTAIEYEEYIVRSLNRLISDLNLEGYPEVETIDLP